MNRQHALQGLYAITDSSLCPDNSLVDQVAQALHGGCRIIQYRDKRLDKAEKLSLAKQLMDLCKHHQALLIINDDVNLAQSVGANGVHLGREDADLSHARIQLGEAAIIGISCYNRLDLAHNAAQAGADYVAFGRFFPSLTKPHAIQATPELLRQAKTTLNLPLVAIGGITPENGAPLIEAGADMLAVVHGIFGQPDIRAACQKLTTLFEPKEN
ncbi:MAG: thiamine phosphate synthase [Candidatus Thiodiazotropha sp. (ex Myrtea sp. 'scaly one' KF741663)]|nr:thiamine phosphate synthase [Candidatus Thiodiazotropha sp. (ex Myrtea sp. 'scaly one' KF741663)]